MAREYDLVILGGGTGGYVAAIRASQLGLKTAIVEKEKLGGTCLHKGCIPSKAFLRSAEVYRQSVNAEQYGIEIQEVKINFDGVQKRKQSIIDQLHNGVKSLMKKGKIDVYYGTGRILGPSIFLRCQALFRSKWLIQKMKCCFPKTSLLQLVQNHVI